MTHFHKFWHIHITKKTIIDDMTRLHFEKCFLIFLVFSKGQIIRSDNIQVIF